MATDIERLRADLERAVAEQNYEEAARLRDRIAGKPSGIELLDARSNGSVPSDFRYDNDRPLRSYTEKWNRELDSILRQEIAIIEGREGLSWEITQHSFRVIDRTQTQETFVYKGHHIVRVDWSSVPPIIYRKSQQ